MKKVITYGTFDLLHYGHIRLLERAKSLGDYLIVGVTSDDFDVRRGKINNCQTLLERIEAIRNTGLADEIIVESYEGQKIDDIKKYDIDIFTVGSDWIGKFDYLKKYCEVVYLDRTEGVSSTAIRTEKLKTTFYLCGTNRLGDKFRDELSYVNGASISEKLTKNVYLYSKPNEHYSAIDRFISNGSNVLCESPIAISQRELCELFDKAKKNNVKLFDGIKTAYSIAFNRAILLAKSGKIGQVLSLNVTCTSLVDFENGYSNKLGALFAWGPTALYSVFSVFGTDYLKCDIITKLVDRKNNIDGFTQLRFIYQNCVANVTVAKSAKAEGEMIIVGEKGYILIPAPWWKTDYFEVRFENQSNNEKYFYKLEGDGTRNMISSFIKGVNNVPFSVSKEICKVLEKFDKKEFLELRDEDEKV